jgi:hypothetical protein
MEYVKYTDNLLNNWDSFVFNESKNGTIFNTKSFLSYHDKTKFDDRSCLFYNKKNLIAVLPAVNFNNCLRSHAGSSFGGLIVSKNIGVEEVSEIVRLLTEYTKKENLSSINITLPPVIYNKLPSDEIEFFLLKNGYKINKLDLACTLDLTSDILLRDSTHRSIQKAFNNKDIVINENDTNFKEYWAILEKNLNDRHNVYPTHTLSDINKLRKLVPNNIKLITANYKNKIISGILIIEGNSNAFETFYIAQDYEYQDLRSLNLVMYTSYMWGTKNKYKYMNLGISTENGGKKINYGLFSFKEGFGARGILRKTYNKIIK